MREQQGEPTAFRPRVPGDGGLTEGP
jgi:hypothetical protein